MKKVSLHECTFSRQDFVLPEHPVGIEKNLEILKSLLSTICEVFWGPTLELCSMFRSQQFWVSLVEIVEHLNISTSLILKLKRYTEQFDNPEQLLSELESEYVRLFINSVKGIRAPLYQSCYENPEQLLMRKSAIQMARRLEESGLKLSNDLSEPPDHICVELEYLYYLLSQGNNSGSIFNEKAVKFLCSVLLPWVEKFVSRIRKDEKDIFFSSWGEIMLGVLRGIDLCHTGRLTQTSTF